EDVKAYFSLGACMEGVSQLASCLFGLKFVANAVLPGETWHKDVIKVDIEDAEGRQVGTVYCDFLEREGKPSQDCHYTIRGGRVINQSPIVCIQLNLTRATDSPPLLLFDEVENLFHEWGHALHSMLARTRYQHVTGTRCSTDLAEIPSTLFESFALHPKVVPHYARHWKTGEPLRDAEQVFERIRLLRGFGQSLEISQQAVHSLLDQQLHSTKPLPAPSNEMLHKIQSEFLQFWFNPALGTAWTHRFGHLSGYGARYYFYLMARAAANLILRRLGMGELFLDPNKHLLCIWKMISYF
ncbi:hypothetical protein Ciccas_012409, partial [Cichlidogyrus casuarinus]